MILQSYKKFFKYARNILQKLAETCKNLQGQIKMLYLCNVKRKDKRKVEREKRKENTLTADNFLLNKSFILVIICKL